ncbi:MAG: M48 family metallopeptidase [Bacteroidales bacterium]|nr:M48 family metallopeptidase [Bacteroidales bacterium]NCU36101.1 M48 family peptidase [Candidatus Falkowbacteria bacterium]MDD2633321.1 M48 family metallopeptidase [Bacteroidales bacterium]MDD3131139.1 M48 family metallopeptidase [Bacteroidales bacterium]MDD3526630.1 M48 family metallopeptidase [Bacteroidales bacterium]
MRKLIIAILFVATTLISGSFMTSCSKVPITGRQQLALLPESQMMSMGVANYNEFLKENPLSNDASKVAMVKNVGQKIAAAVERYMRENGLSDRIDGYKWEFNLVKEDNVPNAWAMPGGKVVIYTGILPYTKTETGLAVVMGHEIAHAVARHGNERMSQALLIETGGTALNLALNQKPEQTRNLFMMAYGLGTQVGISLPYSRTHETEADRLGLIFMAMAGYDPHEAVAFWQRMSQAGGQKPPEFLSTHPADETRVKNLREYMPKAMKYYKQ